MTRAVSRHVVLVEPHWGGHQNAYLRLFALTLLEDGHRVTALCPQPEEPRAWLAAHHPRLVDRFRAATFTRPSPVPAGTRWPERAFAVKFWTETARAVAAAGVVDPDLVFLSWLDSYMHPALPGPAIDQLFPHRWSGLYFFPGEHRGTGSVRGLARQALSLGLPFRGRGCCGVAVLDEIAIAPLERRLAPRPAVVFPDLTDETEPTGSGLADEILQRAAGRRVIASVGALSKRKGIHELIQVCERSADHPWFFVLAGKLDVHGFADHAVRDIVRFIQRPPSNAFVHLQPVPDGNEFNALVAASDLLYCHYLNFPHSSNLLTKAALLRRPVLVTDGHCMAERVRRHRLGVAVPEGDLGAIERGIAQILSQPRANGRDFDGYFAQHATSALRQPFAQLLGGDARAGHN